MIVGLTTRIGRSRYAVCRFALLFVGLSSLALAQNTNSVPVGSEGGVSAVWIFANLSFTAMRAQASGSIFWKIVAFICGFPGTLLTLIIITRGSERAYGIDMPRRLRG